MVRRVLAIVAAVVLVASACGPDEPEGPDLSRFAEAS